MHKNEKINFGTIFALLFSTAMFFATDSPIALGKWNPSLGFFSGTSSYVCHAHMGSDGASARNESVSAVDEGGADVCTFW
jgi:hypothetical protein